MNPYKERILNGIIKENPTFILVLGMCPTLAVTTSVNIGLQTEQEKMHRFLIRKRSNSL